jgi:hypothetical protein
MHNGGAQSLHRARLTGRSPRGAIPEWPLFTICGMQYLGFDRKTHISIRIATSLRTHRSCTNRRSACYPTAYSRMIRGAHSDSGRNGTFPCNRLLTASLEEALLGF